MKYILFLCLLAGFSWTVSAQNGEDDEVILKAMKDEMQRSVEELALPGMPKPSFIAYTLWRYQQFEIVGTLGAITNSFVLPQIASGSVQVQLGTHEHNNDITYVNPATVVGMPAEADYDVIRRSFWQGTDKMYKMSLQELAIKEGLLKKNPLSPEEMSLIMATPYSSTHIRAMSARNVSTEIIASGSSLRMICNPLLNRFISSSAGTGAAFGRVE